MRKNTNLPLNRQGVNSNVFTKKKKLKTIFRATKKNNFSIISNFLIEDSRLSLKARMILVYLLSKPNDWVVRVSKLNNISPQGKRAIQSALKELRKFGYAKLIWTKTHDNRMCSQYFMSELPRKDWAETSHLVSTNIPKPIKNQDTDFLREISNQLSMINQSIPLENHIEDYIYNTYTLNGSKPFGDINGHLILKNKGLTITGFLFKQVVLEKYGRVDLIELKKNQDHSLDIIIYELKRYSLNFKTLQQIIRYSNGIKNLLKSIYNNISFSYSIKFKLIGYKSELEGLNHKKLNIELITYHFNHENGFHFNKL